MGTKGERASPPRAWSDCLEGKNLYVLLILLVPLEKLLVITVYDRHGPGPEFP